MSNPAQLIKNLTLGRRKVTPLNTLSSSSIPTRKASRVLFESEAAEVAAVAEQPGRGPANEATPADEAGETPMERATPPLPQARPADNAF